MLELWVTESGANNKSVNMLGSENRKISPEMQAAIDRGREALKGVAPKMKRKLSTSKRSGPGKGSRQKG